MVDNDDDGTLAEQIERKQLAQRVLTARDLLAKGEHVPRDELRALKKYEKEQLRTLGQRYLKAIPKAQFVELFGGYNKVYIDWRDAHGFPWPANHRVGVNLRDVLQFYRKWFARNGSSSVNADEDDSSRGLQNELERQRIREKDVTYQLKAIELQKALDDWAPIEPIREWHNTLAELILRVREKIVNTLDGEKKELAEQVFDDLGDDMTRLVEERFGENANNTGKDA